ncbi:hypothetical protein C8T65DRAFT_663467 [Cerioporus squamosus]|nr:hypothetical protein C8T65DRAFT_663467 [Cerioporus squamosus]
MGIPVVLRMIPKSQVSLTVWWWPILLIICACSHLVEHESVQEAEVRVHSHRSLASITFNHIHGRMLYPSRWFALTIFHDVAVPSGTLHRECSSYSLQNCMVKSRSSGKHGSHDAAHVIAGLDVRGYITPAHAPHHCVLRRQSRHRILRSCGWQANGADKGRLQPTTVGTHGEEVLCEFLTTSCPSSMHTGGRAT